MTCGVHSESNQYHKFYFLRKCLSQYSNILQNTATIVQQKIPISSLLGKSCHCTSYTGSNENGLLENIKLFHHILAH